MPFTERLMARGDWSVRLRDDAPLAVRNSVATPYGLVVVTPARVQTWGMSDAAMIAAARYVGVLLRTGPALDLGGAGLAWFLGDETGRQPLESAVTQSAASLTTWVTSIIPAQLSVGSISGAGTLSGAYNWVSRREALDSVCQAFNVEWRVNPGRTVDTGTAATLYGSAPTAILVSRDGPHEVGTVQGITATIDAAYDWDDFASKIVLFAGAGRGSSGGASIYRGPDGTLMTLSRAVQADTVQPGGESNAAALVLSHANSTVRTFTVRTSSYDVRGKIATGANVYAYDPQIGLVNTANQVQYRGSLLQPVSARVLAMTQPIERGMGVYVRYHDGTAISYVDLSDYIEWDGPGGTLELGTAIPSIETSSPTTVAEAWTTWDAYTPSVGGMTLGNGTCTGAYRRNGTTMALRGIVTAGSTSANGAGAWTVSLPSGVTGITGMKQTLTGLLTDASAGQVWRLTGIVRSGATTIDFVYADASGLSLAGAQPINIATSDTIEWTGTIEVQP